MKKILVVFLINCMLLLVACSNSNGEADKNVSKTNVAESESGQGVKQEAESEKSSTSEPMEMDELMEESKQKEDSELGIYFSKAAFVEPGEEIHVENISNLKF